MTRWTDLARPGGAGCASRDFWLIPFDRPGEDIHDRIEDAVRDGIEQPAPPGGLPAGEPRGQLLHHGPAAGGLAIAVAVETTGRSVAGYWPRLAGGPAVAVAVESLALAPSRLEAMVQARLPAQGDLRLIWFDQDFPVSRARYAAGGVTAVAPVAIAHVAALDPGEPGLLRPGDPGHAEGAAADPAALRSDGTILVPVRGTVALIHRPDEAPHAWELRGPVRALTVLPRPLIGQPAARATIEVARPPTGAPLVLDVVLTAAVWGDGPWPEPGQELQAVVLLHAGPV